MAIQSVEDQISLITKPKNKTYIDLAVNQEERLVMHCETILEKSNLPFTAYRNFTTWYEWLITKEKYPMIDKMIGTPLSTVSVTKDIFDQLLKFLDAQDRYVDFNFTDVDYTNDYNDYLLKINDDSFWRQRITDALRTDICSVVVIDCPAKQTTKRPEPYKYFVSPRMFIDIDINRNTGNVEYIIFKQSDLNWDGAYYVQGVSNAKLSMIATGTPMEKVIAIDDTTYRIFTKRVSDSYSTDNWYLVSESKHDLGYCPVIDFWQPSIKGTNGINKRGVITSILSKLDYLLFYQACSDYMALYGAFPILVMYDDEEESFEEKTKDTINEAQQTDQSHFSQISNTTQTTDPRKSGRKLMASGTLYKVPSPASKDDYNFMDTPLKFVNMDVESLKHVQEKIKELKNEIVEICTGEDTEYLNEIAKNPEMMSASFERKETIFIHIKRQIERVHRFATKAQAELRYGKEYFIGCTIDYGSDYFLKDSTTLVNEYKDAVEGGMPSYYSSEIATTASITRYKNNNEILARLRILSDLEPYQGMDWKTLQLLQINLTDKINFIIKANFITFIKRFELESGSIVKFGSLIPYSEKINIIKLKLIEYGNAISWTDIQQSTGQSATTSNK